VTKDLTLKEVLQVFLEKCRKNLAGKVFQPYFKQILKYMNNLDPAHLNSLPLKVFVHKQTEMNTNPDMITHIDAVICEIQKYQKSNKRALPSDEEPQAPLKKKVCLTTIANKVPVKPSQEPLYKDSQAKVETTDKVGDSTATLVQDVIGFNKDNGESMDVVEEVTTAQCDNAVEIDVRSAPPDIFQSLGLRPKNDVGLTKSLGVNEEESTAKLEGEKSKSEEDLEKPSSSQHCFNENLVHEKDKKKAKKVSPAHITKLEKALKKCAKEIQRLEEAEVDWDEDNDSNYILCAKYKRRYMDLFKKIADYKELSSSLDRKSEKKFICNESRYPEINKKIQKFVNKTKEFPDFQDIKRLVKAANSTLHLSTLQMHDEAENIFQTVGKKLKKRREIDDTDVMVSYLKENQMEDPAAKDQELDKVLMVQAVEGKKNINKYFDDFYKTHVVNAKSGSEVDTEAKIDKEQEEPKAIETLETKHVKDDTVQENLSLVEMDEKSSGLASDKKEVSTDGETDAKVGNKSDEKEVPNEVTASSLNNTSTEDEVVAPKSCEESSEVSNKSCENTTDNEEKESLVNDCLEAKKA